MKCSPYLCGTAVCLALNFGIYLLFTSSKRAPLVLLQSPHVSSADTGLDHAEVAKIRSAALWASELRTCRWVLVNYVPSEWEREWVMNVRDYEDKVCERSNENVAAIEEWVTVVALNNKERVEHLSSTTFSKFLFRNNCTGEVVTDYIEPLAGLTRHPYLCLKGEEYKVNKDYLFVSWNAARKVKPLGGGYRPKAYYFDLGASLFDSGSGGASQQWFVELYETRGITWNGVYCWEASPQNPTNVWKRIPARLKPVYHWYNVPADPEPESSDNPLNYIRAIARPEDFVVLKIDIDNSPIEKAFVQQLLSSPGLLGLVDDFYFEHHVNVAPMYSSWRTQRAAEKLHDTYEIFTALRRHGVAAHSWV